MKQLVTVKSQLVMGGLTFIILFGSTYYALIHGLPFANFGFLLAGLVTLFVMYGQHGLKTVFAPLPQTGFLRSGLRCYGLALLVMVSGIIAVKVFHIPTANNPIGGLLTEHPFSELLQTIPALLGEELFAICALFIVATLTFKVTGNASWAVASGWLVSAIAFGALHIPTYDGHVVQAILLIGSMRLPFTKATFETNTIWAGFLVHLAYDWTLFIVMLLINSR